MATSYLPCDKMSASSTKVTGVTNRLDGVDNEAGEVEEELGAVKDGQGGTKLGRFGCILEDGKEDLVSLGGRLLYRVRVEIGNVQTTHA